MHWFLSQDQEKIDIQLYIKGIAELKTNLSDFVLEPENKDIYNKVSDLVNKGVSENLAFNIGTLDLLYLCLDVIWLNKKTNYSLQDCSKVFFALMHNLDLLWLRDKIKSLPDTTVWESLARRSAREEFNSVCSHLSLATLQEESEGMEEKVDNWLLKSDKSIIRYKKLLALVHSGELIELEKITVLLKELRELCV